MRQLFIALSCLAIACTVAQEGPDHERGEDTTMTTAVYSINFSGVLSATSGPVSVGDVLVPDASGLYVVATSANRGTKRSDGISLTTANPGEPVPIQANGKIDPAYTGLGAGTASWVRTSTTGRLQRVASPASSDDVVGWCETDGSMHAFFGVGSALFAPPAGSDKQIQYNSNGAVGASAALTWNDTLRSLTAGDSAIANGHNAIALGNGAVASGDQGVAIGDHCTASSTFSIAMGGTLTTASAAGAVALGEVLTASQPNAVAIGYNSNASGTYSVAIGVGNNALAEGSVAMGLSASSTRPGQYAHSSGTTGVAGLNAIDLQRTLNATSGALQTRTGTSFTMAGSGKSLYSMRVRIVGGKAGGGVVGHEVRELLIKSDASSATIVENYLVREAPVGGFAGLGWSAAISAPSGLEIRITCDSGADNVRWGARLEWLEEYNL